MTRSISVGLVVRVEDDVAEDYETLHRYLEAGLLSEVNGNIRSVVDITDEIEAVRRCEP